MKTSDVKSSLAGSDVDHPRSSTVVIKSLEIENPGALSRVALLETVARLVFVHILAWVLLVFHACREHTQPCMVRQHHNVPTRGRKQSIR